MVIHIFWKDSEDVALLIGTIMCEIPHKEGMPITVSTDKNGDSGQNRTTITNEGDK